MKNKILTITLGVAFALSSFALFSTSAEAREESLEKRKCYSLNKPGSYGDQCNMSGSGCTVGKMCSENTPKEFTEAF